MSDEISAFGPLWSGSTVSNNTNNAWIVNLGNGNTNNNNKNNSNGVVCVRP
jgi:hypothetical protein